MVTSLNKWTREMLKSASVDHGSGRQPLFSNLENLICEWVVDRRAKALVGNRAQIQEFALAMAPQFDITPEDFKASQHWLDNFLQRSELSLRRSTCTTLFRLEDTQVIKRALAFKSFIDDADFYKYNLSNMIAMDETAVFMDQTSQTTIEQQGASLVYIPSTAYKSAHVSCILVIWMALKSHLSSFLRARRKRLNVFWAFLFLKLKKPRPHKQL
uniref:HTH CENPB-type domain-containing protein n=1 Tax=Pipistrellus kuhlii TaxID=59472 RepID=A0A7J7ZJN6_PIPKU|nr:hypothetical protein mPipKuh1_009550 [Pipistrellus kuhlii]